MERDEFLKSLGISLAMVCAGTCLQSCGKGDSDDTGSPGTNPPPGGGGNNVSVDISTMGSVGSSTTSNGVLFIRMATANAASSFVATEALCPHQGGTLTWQQNKIICGNHAATYSSNGAVTGQPNDGGQTRALKIYTVTLTGNTLTAAKT